jgi:hypothetical protein
MLNGIKVGRNEVKPYPLKANSSPFNFPRSFLPGTEHNDTDEKIDIHS